MSAPGFPADWTMRETAHYNGGRDWFGYEYQCNQQPRLRRLDRYTRKDRSVASTWRVDGQDCLDAFDALERLSHAPVLGEDELAVLAQITPEVMSKKDLDALNIDWRNRQDRLSAKGLIWWEKGQVRRTPLGGAMLAARGEQP